MQAFDEPRTRPLPAVAIEVNGVERRVAAGTDLAALLDAIGLDKRKVAIERNAQIVPRSLHASTRLAAGDRIEIVQFVGGG